METNYLNDKLLLWYHLGYYVNWLATCHLQDKIFWNRSMPEKKPKWNLSKTIMSNKVW
jgi:hypothetical protein